MTDKIKELADLLLASQMELSDAMAELDFEDVFTRDNLADLSRYVSLCSECSVWFPAKEKKIIDGSILCGECSLPPIKAPADASSWVLTGCDCRFLRACGIKPLSEWDFGFRARLR